MHNQKGQLLIVLLLVMTVGLGLGLSVLQRSITDVSISTKIEESSKAFSIAEAGIEKALQQTQIGNISITETDSTNRSSASVDSNKLLPSPLQAVEYPPISKEEIAQVWLADPSTSPPTEYYKKKSLWVYWGTRGPITLDSPALEVTVVYLKSGTYESEKFYLDPKDDRIINNNFRGRDSSFICNDTMEKINTTQGDDRSFLCKAKLELGNPGTSILLRARILYSKSSHPFAVAPIGGSFPPQVTIINSTGSAGQTKRVVQVFKIDQVVPFFFDYALFSAGDISKQ